MNRVEMIQLASNIINSIGTEKEINDMIQILEVQTKCPEISDYIFYPDDEDDVTPERVIEKALAYQPIQL